MAEGGDAVSVGSGHGHEDEEARSALDEASGGEDAERHEEPRDEEPEEALRPKGMRDPGEPTQREREEHELTHQPPRPSCFDCCSGRGQHDHHRSVERQDPPEETAIPCISMDYCFMGNSFTPAKNNPILVMFDNRTSTLGAWQVYR